MPIFTYMHFVISPNQENLLLNSLIIIEVLMIQRSLTDDRLNRQKYRFHYIHLLPKLNKHSESIAEAIHVPYRPQQISKGHNSHNKICL